MDDFNRPLYGDVFGVLQGAEIAVSELLHVWGTQLDILSQHQNEVDRSLWGEIEHVEEGM